jgi:bidirectional [NiFe] hydrogenase diaphorase subunit
MSDTAEVKTLIIDGEEVSALRGQTILEVARENDINIPTLCHLEGLSDVGACRLCLVEIKGSNKLLPACVATVFEGMEVTTNSERLQKHRRTILEMLFAERNHICSVCVSNGRCESACRIVIPSSPWMPRTSGTLWTTIAASSARVACGPALRLKARTCGM